MEEEMVFLEEHELIGVAQSSPVTWVSLAFTASSGAPCSLPWACLAPGSSQDRAVRSIGREGPLSTFTWQLLT